ncbi:MAG: GNAT family N-acetyltransferase [Ardenticatenaceae bacterium]|nr:GNAT family N-acetyltransferase [Ardenticatenaceae bacterium]
MQDSKLSTYDLMEMHIRALYVHDEQGCLLSNNDWQRGPAPRFFLGRTSQGNVWRFRHDLPKTVCDELSALCKEEEFSTSAPPAYQNEYLQILAAHAPIDKIWLGSAYWFAQPVRDSGGTTFIEAQNAHLLQGGPEEWIPDMAYQQPAVALLVDGQAVAICASVRITEDAHEAGVETVQAQRRKGYAVKVVAAWAREVKRRGALPLYSLSDENIASQNVAQRLGMAKFGTDFHIT